MPLSSWLGIGHALAKGVAHCLLGKPLFGFGMGLSENSYPARNSGSRVRVADSSIDKSCRKCAPQNVTLRDTGGHELTEPLLWPPRNLWLFTHLQTLCSKRYP
jgi:hypothetical protein